MARITLRDGIADAHAKKKHKDAAAFIGLILKAEEQASRGDEVTVKVRLATPAKAREAVIEIFGENAAKPAEAYDGEAEPSDGDPESPPEE